MIQNIKQKNKILVVFLLALIFSFNLNAIIKFDFNIKSRTFSFFAAIWHKLRPITKTEIAASEKRRKEHMDSEFDKSRQSQAESHQRIIDRQNTYDENINQFHEKVSQYTDRDLADSVTRQTREEAIAKMRETNHKTQLSIAASYQDIQKNTVETKSKASSIVSSMLELLASAKNIFGNLQRNVDEHKKQTASAFKEYTKQRDEKFSKLEHNIGTTLLAAIETQMRVEESGRLLANIQLKQNEQDTQTAELEKRTSELMRLMLHHRQLQQQKESLKDRGLSLQATAK